MFAESSARTEQDFVELGGTLGRLYSVATELTRLVSERAGGLRGALAQSRLTGVGGLAAQSLRELRATLEASAGLLDSLREAGGALKELRAPVDGIERIGAFLKSLAVSFAIETCRTAECQQAFGAFVHDLRTLATRIARLGEDMSEAVRTTQRFQACGLARLSSSLEEMREVARRLEATATTTAAEAQQLLDLSFGALREAEERARQIAHHAGQAVYYLQFGDIIRQKGEHILAALEEAAGTLAEGDSAEDFGARAAAAEHVLVIQAGQIDLVRQEVLTAQTKLANAFQSIADETSRLACELERGQTALPGHGGAANPLQALTQASLRLEDLQQEGRVLGQQARATARQAQEASTQLGLHLERVKNINVEMRLQAVNAIIKTAALGAQGAALEVLSRHVNELSCESNQEVAEVVATLTTILQQTRDTAPKRGSIQTESSEGVPSESVLRGGLERIALAYEGFTQTAIQAKSLAQKQRAALSNSSAELKFLADLAETLAEHLQEMTSLRQLMAPWKTEAGTPSERTEESLNLRYTMQSERDMHQRASELASLAMVPSAPPASAGNLELSEPAFGENVELF